MEHVLFYIAGFPIYSYGFALAAGLFFGSLVAFREAKRRGIGIYRMLDFVVGASIAFLLGGQLVAGFQELGVRILLRPWILLTTMDQGVSILGGLFFAVFYGVWFVYRNNLIVSIFLDAVAPSIALVQAIAALGSNVYGRGTELAWAVHFGHLSLHPLPVYAAVGYYSVFTILWRNRRNTRFDGQLFLGYLALGAWLQFILSFFAEVGGMSVSPWLYALLAVALTGLWSYLFINSPMSSNRRWRPSTSSYLWSALSFLLTILLFVLIFYWRIS